jgi:hypothetical protein
MAVSFAIRQSKTILARSCEAGRGFVAIGNKMATMDRLPSIAVDFESSAVFLKAGAVYFR